MTLSNVNFTMTLSKNNYIYSGAGFITVLLGDIMTMPGLSKRPALEKIDILPDGTVTGIF